jgi:erythromycin esterase-like protein
MGSHRGKVSTGGSTIQFKDMTTAIEDVMKLLPARPRVLALGEPTHGEDVLLEVRNQLFRHLVEHEGFRTIAIESDCLMGLVADDYVTAGTGTLDDAMARGFSHEFGKSAANRELLRWMRAYNDGRPVAEHVRFAGFDGPLEISHGASPRPALTELHTYLAARVGADLLPCTAGTLDRLIGADERWANPETMMNPGQSIGRTPEAKELRLIADDLAALLESQTPEITDGERPRLYARTATGLLRYHYWLADTSPGRLTWLLNVRASMMAANLLALAERGPVLAFAHNSHLQRPKSSMRLGDIPLRWWSAGAIVGAHLGDGYAFLSTALGTIPRHGVGAPPPDTIEGLLYARPEDRFLVDPRTLGSPAPRESPWFGYAPLDPAHLPSIDAIVYVKDAGSA